MDSMCGFAWIQQCTEISILYMLHYDVVQHVLAWIGRDASYAVQTSAHAVAVLCSVCKFDGFAVCFKNVLEFCYWNGKLYAHEDWTCIYL